MIRKAIRLGRLGLLTLLTLLALAMAVGTIKGGLDLDEWTVWELDAERALWLHQSLRESALMYWVVGDPSMPVIRWDWFGFGFVRSPMYSQPDNKYSHTSYGIFCPGWFGIVGSGTYPLIAFIRGPLRRYRRRKHGLCVRCGYNLTGLPEPRCPECGTEVKKP